MLQGTDEDVNLVTQMVDKCDIKESFLYILALIPHKYEEFATFCSPLSNSYLLHKYLLREHTISVHYNLDMLVKMWSTHCKELSLGLPIYTQGQKFLAMEYVTPPTNNFKKSNKHGIKPLNPKKRR